MGGYYLSEEKKSCNYFKMQRVLSSTAQLLSPGYSAFPLPHSLSHCIHLLYTKIVLLKAQPSSAEPYHQPPVPDQNGIKT